MIYDSCGITKKFNIKIRADVEKIILSMEDFTIAKIMRSIDLLEKFAYRLGSPNSKKVKNKIFELRIRGKQEVRIFYTILDKKIILFHVFLKKSQKIPKYEIELAERKLKDLT